jgi:hypothetical protein
MRRRCTETTAWRLRSSRTGPAGPSKGDPGQRRPKATAIPAQVPIDPLERPGERLSGHVRRMLKRGVGQFLPQPREGAGVGALVPPPLRPLRVQRQIASEHNAAQINATGRKSARRKSARLREPVAGQHQSPRQRGRVAAVGAKEVRGAGAGGDQHRAIDLTREPGPELAVRRFSAGRQERVPGHDCAAERTELGHEPGRLLPAVGVRVHHQRGPTPAEVGVRVGGQAGGGLRPVGHEAEDVGLWI